MKAFHGDILIKEKYLARIKAHQVADEIVKGQYWENGKGCAVGCTLHSGNHSAYEEELGIPEWLAHVEDMLFEGMSNDRSKEWPFLFLDSINIGADLEKAKAPFLIFILADVLNYFNHEQFPEVKKAVGKVIELYKKDDATTVEYIEVIVEAEAAAAMAGWATEAEAVAAVRAADAAEWTAREAAWAAARTAALAAARASWATSWAARAAARTAARAAAPKAASSSSEAVAAVTATTHGKYADKLIEIIKGLYA